MKKEDVTLKDEAIIKEVLSGNVALYEAIMRRFNQRLYRIGRGFFKNDDAEIEDIMQFTYVKAYEKLSSFQFRASFATWLTRIFINEALQRLNFRKRFDNSFFDKEDEDDSIITHTHIKMIEMNTPYTKTINNELKELLEAALNKLPEKYRTVFIMREVERMSIQETSQSLKLSETNVKVRLNRAKKMLREELSSYYHADEIFNFNLVRCDVIVKNVFDIILSKSKFVN
ncbi:MAG TPA: RNA polymerase sigma factor [Ignavibacteriaceae bacterium]|nr:RNA polymerase sigma factor [Ignavibacteriaceae bacterium]